MRMAQDVPNKKYVRHIRMSMYKLSHYSYKHKLYTYIIFDNLDTKRINKFYVCKTVNICLIFTF